MDKMLIAAFAAVVAGPVLAGNLYEPQPEVDVFTPPMSAPVYDWSGIYAGAGAGALFGSMDYAPGGAWSIGNAMTYGGFAGYNFQSGSMVYGGELAVNMYDGFPAGFPAESFSYIADAKARVGYAMDNILGYGFAGGSLSEYNEVTTWGLYGANFGAGVELGVTDNISVGGEYIGRYLFGDTATPGQVQTNWLHGAQARVAIRF